MNSSKSHAWGNFLSHPMLNLKLSGHSCVQITPLSGHHWSGVSLGVERRLPSMPELQGATNSIMALIVLHTKFCKSWLITKILPSILSSLHILPISLRTGKCFHLKICTASMSQVTEEPCFYESAQRFLTAQFAHWTENKPMVLPICYNSSNSVFKSPD